MKIKSFFIAFLGIMLMAIPATAQAPQEITLTVSSDGPTKEDATKNALRTAIEQAFGAFVSANTTILNDELVKDEIVTVSNGSIKDYKEISAIQTDNGNHFVTLTATVSLPNLITYAKSHGSECEFAGNTFALNEKIRDLQYCNAEKILDNLKETVLHTKHMFDYNIILNEPKLEGDKYLLTGTIYIMGNGNTLSSILLMDNTIRELCKQLNPNGGYERINGCLYLTDTGVEPVIWMPKLNRDSWSLQKYTSLWFNGRDLLTKIAADFQICDNISTPTAINVRYRSDNDNNDPLSDIDYTFSREYPGCKVRGFGSIKKPYKQENFEKDCRDAKNSLVRDLRKYTDNRWFKMDNEGLVLDPNIEFPISYSVVPSDYGWAIKMVYLYLPLAKVNVSFNIPKEDIGKYSKFWIEPKQ